MNRRLPLAIHVENLSKQYRLEPGRRQAGYRTLREELARGAAAPLRWLRGARRTAGETFWALRDVSFDVERGEVVGIIGHNGAGKSTLLKILSRVTLPSTGWATIRGRLGSLLEVGTGFHPELTGRENIYLNGAVLGMGRREIGRKFDEIAAFAEVEPFLETPMKRYSTGMYVRLAFAVAAHLESEVLLIDEVLAVGDAAFQAKCLGKMGEVARQGRTILFVSHNMAAVNQLCPRTFWLNRGRIERAGPSFDVVAQYIAAGGTPLAERCWSYPGNAPGDDRVRLLGCRVLQSDVVTEVVDINAPSHVEIDFSVLAPARNLVAGVSAYNAEHLCLFAHCDWRPNRLAPGNYRKQIQFPAHLFAEGKVELLVQLIFYEPDVPSVVFPGALAFEAVDSRHPQSVRGPYKGRWPGVVRPHLAWSDAIELAPAGNAQHPQ